MIHRDGVKREKEIDRLLAFSAKEREAFKIVQVFLVAVGLCCEEVCCTAPWNEKDLHRFFISFCKKMGFRGHLYQPKKGILSPAMVLYLGWEDLPAKHFFMLVVERYADYRWRLDGRTDRQRILEAATEVCREWLLSWNWTVPE